MMPITLRASAAIVIAGAAAHAQTTTPPTIERFLSPASPLEITSARRADRIAWMAYERGLRNVYTAAAPDFGPTRVTRYLEDDGTDLSDVELSDDGSIVVFVRGSAPNREGWVANPSHDPDGAERAIWAARTTRPGPSWRVAEGAAPALSPDGRWVLYTRGGQIHRAPVVTPANPTPIDRGEKPFIVAWGTNSQPRWSPDGSRIAFVSNRGDHSFIAVYDVKTRSVAYVAPSVDFDNNPVWSADGKQLAFLRRPGTPFGLQSQEGGGGIGNPPGAATGRAGAPGGRGRGGDAPAPNNQRDVAGLFRATFAGGHTLMLMTAEVERCSIQLPWCEAKEIWRNAPDERVFTTINNLRWAGNHVVFPLNPPGDEWDRWWSISLVDPQPKPVLLTTTDGLVEDATSVAVSQDGRTLYYTTNAQDIERRHIWAVPTAGGTPRRVTQGNGIETYPAPLASGRQIAFLYFDHKQPASIGLAPTTGGTPRIVFPTLPRDFPTAAHVMPEVVKFKAPDGLEISNQLFLPPDYKPGEKRPAMVFVHGGPARQMMPGYHYFQFYHWSYALNQWLANQGYVVLSVNFRSGIGYGRSFRNPPNTNRRGNAEYQDVLAAGHWLQQRAEVDPKRVGIWGLSYGGLLTAQALARNSNVFVAGVDLAGVHLYDNIIDSTAMSYRSSAISAIDGWKSPVFLVHGDDDRNVAFSQTVGLVQLLRARNIHHELIVVPDDLHESMLHSRWIHTFDRIGDFINRFVRDRQEK